jgi:hypothetical protein
VGPAAHADRVKSITGVTSLLVTPFLNPKLHDEELVAA